MRKRTWEEVTTAPGAGVNTGAGIMGGAGVF
jgi:hypothetical protein